MVDPLNAMPRRVVLDHETLSSCVANDPIEDWRRKLRNAGVLREPLAHLGLGPSGGDGAKVSVEAWAEVQRRFYELERADEALEAILGWTELAWAHRKALGVIAAATLIGIELMGQVAILFGILGVLIGALMFSPRRRGRAQRRREKAAESLIAAVQHLMSQSFIESSDGVIFEAAPHRAFLVRRIDDLRLERAGLEARQSELVHLRAQLIRANEALGLPPEDGEVRAVDEERARLTARDAGLISLEQRLERQLEDFNRALERLRLLATREALSRKVGELLEERRGDAALRAAAEIEVDVVAIHAEMSRLGVRLSDADLSLRAALEAEAAARGQSTRLIAETKPKPEP
ncbi:MAG: hypothetical protein RIT28_5096 [Pseudomonadota bacterium]